MDTLLKHKIHKNKQKTQDVILYEKGINYYKSKDYNRAIDNFRAANLIKEKYYIHYYMALCYIELKDFLKADYHINRTVE